MTTARGQRPRLDHVDGIRAMAALVVFANHAFAQVYSHIEYPTGLLSIFSFSMVAGHLSVTVFIVVSGFCLALPVIENGNSIPGGFATFVRRRARRVLPPYYAALALSLLLIATVIGKPTGTLWDVSIMVDWKAIVSHALLVQDLFRTGRINYVFWSIAVEWQIYFLMPVLIWGWRRYGAVSVIAIALLLGYALRLGFDATRLARAAPHYAGMFALGIAAAYIVRSPDFRFTRLSTLPWKVICGLGVLVVFALVHSWGIPGSIVRLYYLDLPAGLAAFALLIETSRPAAGTLNRIFSFRPLVFIGTFSYSLYLVHAPLLQLLWQYTLDPFGLSPATSFLMLSSVGLLLILFLSYWFFRAFEAPFIRTPPLATRQVASVS